MDMQQDELTILEVCPDNGSRMNADEAQSIYPDQVTRHASEKGQSVTIRIDIALPTPTKIVCRHLANTSHPLIGGGQVDVSSIGIITPVLPPLLVSLDLAPTYPATTAPCITALRSSAGDSWLPPGTEQRITDELQTLWAAAEGEGVLWSWIDWLASGTFMDVGSTESDITRDGASYMYVRIPPFLSISSTLPTVLPQHPNSLTYIPARTPPHSASSTQRDHIQGHDIRLRNMLRHEKRPRVRLPPVHARVRVLPRLLVELLGARDPRGRGRGRRVPRVGMYKGSGQVGG